MIARQREKRANSVKAIGVNRVKIQDGRANRDRPGRGRVTVQIQAVACKPCKPCKSRLWP